VTAVGIRYRAFLSYSHRDKAWGKWLHSALEGYRIGADLVGRKTLVGPVPKTLRPIFRDRENFSAGHSLTEQTLAALDASQFLVVVCSPNATLSRYVNEEIRRFKETGGAEGVIGIIVDGEPGDPARECFPPALRFKVDSGGALTEEREEPVAADARPEGEGKRLALQKIVSALLGVPLDDVRKREAIDNSRRIGIAAAGAGVFAVLVLAAGFFSVEHLAQKRQLTMHEERLVEQEQELLALHAELFAVSPARAEPGASKALEDFLKAAYNGATAGDNRLQQALNLLKAHKLADAEEWFRAVAEEKAARKSKDAAAAFRNLGTIAGFNDGRRARDAYLKAVELDPGDQDSRHWAPSG
jgi:hypothetical protein